MPDGMRLFFTESHKIPLFSIYITDRYIIVGEYKRALQQQMGRASEIIMLSLLRVMDVLLTFMGKSFHNLSSGFHNISHACQ